MKILLTAINAKYIHSNLAVYDLKAYVNRSEEEVSICEYTINNSLEEILDGIYTRKPDILAFSCYIWNIEYIQKLIIEMKKVLPNVKIWLGGPEAFYNSKRLLEVYPDIDLIMKGEGEITFGKLSQFYCPLSVKEYLDNKSQNPAWEDEFLCRVSGIDFLSREGRVICNPSRPAMDMSDIPFPYANMQDFENKIIYYESSRGCPFSCSYCLSSIEKQLRFRNIELVKKELKFFMDNKVPQVKFVDRTFNCKKSHAMAIWQFIFDNDNGITNFHFEIAADLIDEEELELISKMRPGLIQLEIGVQSTNPTTISEIHRKMDLDKLSYVVNKINSFENTLQHLDLITGLPYENLDSFIKSFNDVYKLHPSELQLGFLKVLSGSYMYEQKENYGIKYKNYPPYEVLSTNWISYDDVILLKGVEEMVEVYYNSGQFVVTLNYLINYFKEPFNMFYELNKYYEVHYDKSMKHSRIARYNILLEFFLDYLQNNFKNCYQTPEDSSKKVSLARAKEELTTALTVDVYLRENCKSRPNFASDLSQYRYIIKETARGLGLNKNEHIEIIPDYIMEKLDLEGIAKAKKLNTDFALGKTKEQSENVQLTKEQLIKEQLIKEQSENVLSGISNSYFVIFDYENRSVIDNQSRLLVWKVKYGQKEC